LTRKLHIKLYLRERKKTPYIKDILNHLFR